MSPTNDMLTNMSGSQASEENEKLYYLMNKDRVVAEFIIRGEGALEECISIKGTENIPMYFGSVNTWVANRSAAKHRKHIKKLLSSMGGTTKSGFINLTHCLSVNDTFWVRGSHENISWKDANLIMNSQKAYQRLLLMVRVYLGRNFLLLLLN